MQYVNMYISKNIIACCHAIIMKMHKICHHCTCNNNLWIVELSDHHMNFTSASKFLDRTSWGFPDELQNPEHKEPSLPFHPKLQQLHAVQTHRSESVLRRSRKNSMLLPTGWHTNGFYHRKIYLLLELLIIVHWIVLYLDWRCTNYIILQINLCIDVKDLPSSLIPYLPLYIEVLFESPLIRNEGLLFDDWNLYSCIHVFVMILFIGKTGHSQCGNIYNNFVDQHFY